MTNRQPAGIPTGGQFARGSRDRAAIELERLSTFPEDLPRYSQDYTPAQRQQVVDWFAEQPLSRLRRDQDLTSQQIGLAHELATKPNPPLHIQDTLLDLQTKADILTDAVMQQNFPETRPAAPASDAEVLAAIERGRQLGAADPSGFVREDLPEGMVTANDAVDRLAATGIDRDQAAAIVMTNRQHDISATDRDGRIVPVMTAEQVDTLVAIVDPSAPKPPSAGPRPVTAAEVGRVTPERMAKQAREMLDEDAADARY